ncbi:uncharacterized protein TNCV_1923561 [Trichonephila clavipes]|nr:uncharacterized protein TNCV_1923561 [Trichonephila clavipes]
MRVLYRSRQNDRLCVMLVLVHIDITPPHTPLPVFQRIGERMIPYSWQACKQFRHLVGCVICVRRLENCIIRVTVWLPLRWIDGAMTETRENCVFISRPGSPMKGGRFVLGTLRSERMRVLYRSRENDRPRVMLVLVHIDITPLHLISHKKAIV